MRTVSTLLLFSYITTLLTAQHIGHIILPPLASPIVSPYCTVQPVFMIISRGQGLNLLSESLSNFNEDPSDHLSFSVRTDLFVPSYIISAARDYFCGQSTFYLPASTSISSHLSVFHRRCRSPRAREHKDRPAFLKVWPSRQSARSSRHRVGILITHKHP